MDQVPTGFGRAVVADHWRVRALWTNWSAAGGVPLPSGTARVFPAARTAPITPPSAWSWPSTWPISWTRTLKRCIRSRWAVAPVLQPQPAASTSSRWCGRSVRRGGAARSPRTTAEPGESAALGALGPPVGASPRGAPAAGHRARALGVVPGPMRGGPGRASSSMMVSVPLGCRWWRRRRRRDRARPSRCPRAAVSPRTGRHGLRGLPRREGQRHRREGEVGAGGRGAPACGLTTTVTGAVVACESETVRRADSAAGVALPTETSC